MKSKKNQQDKTEDVEQVMKMPNQMSLKNSSQKVIMKVEDLGRWRKKNNINLRQIIKALMLKLKQR